MELIFLRIIPREIFDPSGYSKNILSWEGTWNY